MMNDPLPVYYSNRVEKLIERLKRNLYASSQPFSRRLIVLPSPAMKSSLMMDLASDPNYGIAAGFEMCYLDQVIRRLLPQANFPFSMELALGVEVELRAVANAELTEEEQSCWRPFLDMLPESQKRKDKRLLTLSLEFAHLFQLYGKYAGQMLNKWWVEENPSHWQQALWKRVMQKNGWDFFNDHLRVNTQDLHLHLFCINHYSRSYYAFLTKLKEIANVHMYVLSPCQAFWSDLKRGHDEANPLLINNGKLGRELARLIEENETLTHEEYVIHRAALEYPAYQESILGDEYVDEGMPELTLLHALQTDMLLLRKPIKNEPVSLKKEDSLQIHSATTAYREVQILHDNLLRLMDRHPDLTQQDILVMAPNIPDYAPHIKAVFSQGGLKNHIIDCYAISQSPLLQDFTGFLHLAFSRWDPASVLQVLESSFVKKRHQFSDEDVATIRYWIKTSNVWWGVSVEHREEILKRDHCPVGLVDKNPVGTWEWAFDRLVYGLAVEEAEADFPLSPLGCVDTTQIELLGKWISFMHTLRKDLEPLVNGTTMTVTSWLTTLKELLDGYFETNAMSEADTVLNDWLTTQRFTSQELLLEKIPFSTVLHHMETELNSKSLSFADKNIDAVRFCSLLPMRAVPAKVIALLGMQDGVFPQSDRLHYLDCMQEGEYVPSQRDYDRFLFLECLLSSREYFLLSYQRVSDKDGQAQSPSLLVSELLNYCDSAFTLEGACPSEYCVKEHPHSSFDARYFDGNKQAGSYSQFDYQLAKVLYQEKVTPHCYLPAYNPVRKEAGGHHIIELSQLSLFARNPIRSYLQNTQGIYLKDRERDLFKEEPFSLSHLEQYRMKQAALTGSIEDVVKQAEKEGQLPLGIFRHLAVDGVREDIEQFHMHFQKVGLKKEHFFDVELSEFCEKKEQIAENTWRVPAIQVTCFDQTRFTLVGRLSDVTPQGYVTLCRDDRQDILKIWPLFLAMHATFSQYDFSCKSQILFMRNGKAKQPFYDCPMKQLEAYFNYYIMALQSASPLLPELTFDILSTTPEEWEKIIDQKINNPFRPLINPYFQWIAQGQSQKIHSNWKQEAECVFGELYRQWYPSKKTGKNNETI